MADFDELISFLNEKFSAIDNRFSAIDDRFSAIDDRFSAIDERFDDLRRYISLSVEAIRSDNRAFVEGLNAHRGRLDEHDRAIAVLQGSHQDLDGRLSRLEQ